MFPSVHSRSIPDPDVYKKSIRTALDRAGHPEMEGLHALRRHVGRRLEEAGLSRLDRESLMGHTITVEERHYSTHGVPQRALEALSHHDGTSDEAKPFDTHMTPVPKTGQNSARRSGPLGLVK